MTRGMRGHVAIGVEDEDSSTQVVGSAAKLMRTYLVFFSYF